MLKVKLILMAFCLCIAGASQLYLKGIDDGLKVSDNQAFDAYTHFAKQMQHAHAKPVKEADVFAKAGF